MERWALLFLLFFSKVKCKFSCFFAITTKVQKNKKNSGFIRIPISCGYETKYKVGIFVDLRNMKPWSKATNQTQYPTNKGNKPATIFCWSRKCEHWWKTSQKKYWWIRKIFRGWQLPGAVLEALQCQISWEIWNFDRKENGRCWCWLLFPLNVKLSGKMKWTMWIWANESFPPGADGRPDRTDD